MVQTAQTGNTGMIKENPSNMHPAKINQIIFIIKKTYLNSGGIFSAIEKEETNNSPHIKRVGMSIGK